MAEIFDFEEDTPTTSSSTTTTSSSSSNKPFTKEPYYNITPNINTTAASGIASKISNLTAKLVYNPNESLNNQPPITTTTNNNINNNQYGANEMDELCDTVAELNTIAFPSFSPVRTRAIPITITSNGNTLTAPGAESGIPMTRGRSGSGSFLPGSADGRAGKSFEIGIKSPFVSSFADKAATDTISEKEEEYEENDNKKQVSQANRKMHPWDFDRLKVLGEGTYGKVLLVREKRTGRLFAQKQLKKASMVVEEKKIQQTKTEREILESVRHPYIVKLFYAMQDLEKLYLILEYVQGGELFTYLADQSMLSEDTAAFYLAEMVLALHHLHTNVGVVYRDLKPENCLLDSDGHLVLTDFGLSKVATGDDDERCNTFLGTPEYMAPEILQGEEYDYAVDWWSLGAVANDLLTGSPPFPGSNYKAILNKIWSTKRITFPFYLTRDAQNLISRLLTRDPKKRLGHKDIDFIKKHSFFESVDWDRLEARDPSLVPPIVPIITDPEKAENFSKEFTEMPLTPPEYTNEFMEMANGSKGGSGAGGEETPTKFVPIPSKHGSSTSLAGKNQEDDNAFKGFSFTASQSFIDCAF